MCFEAAKIACLVVVACLAGCGKTDPSVPRVDLRGTVTWGGRPVPAGFVIFSPDASKHNSGPQGMAAIVNGKYDTRGTDGRAAVPGPLVATIQGFDGIPAGEERSRGMRLFMPFELPVEVSDSSGELDIAVPDSVAPLPR